jgi:hypothetical protein
VRKNSARAVIQPAAKTAIKIEPKESAKKYTPNANNAETPDADHNEIAAKRLVNLPRTNL